MKSALSLPVLCCFLAACGSDRLASSVLNHLQLACAGFPFGCVLVCLQFGGAIGVEVVWLL